MEILNYTKKELETLLVEHGYKKFRARQIFQWIYDKLVFDFDEMTNISKKEREEMKEIFTITPFAQPEIHSSSDGTEKFQFDLEDGSSVEAVIIPEKDRNTLCISTQIGCALKCSFCRTGHLGFSRDLTVREIVGQVLHAKAHLEKRDSRVTNIVYMGMGEPLLNMENTVKSIDILKDDLGFNLSNRRITVSTSGVTDRIVELGDRTGANFALSLHATEQETRAKIMPIARKFPLDELVDAVAKYPMHHRKRVLLEYVMLKGVNDTKADAKRLVKIAGRLNAKVNLIPFNCFDGCIYESTGMDEILSFQKVLTDRNITAFIRKSRGDDSLAACGQLGHVKK